MKFFFCSILSTLKSGSERCDTICILAVPATMTCNDLLNFTAACHENIKHLRIIKDGTPNQYMALLTFRSQVIILENHGIARENVRYD